MFASSGRGEIILALLKAGADRHHPEKHGVSPSQLAKKVNG